MAQRQQDDGRGRQDLAVVNPENASSPEGAAVDSRWDARAGNAADAERNPRRSRRGFAAMDPAQHREISRRGGQASHLSGRGHEWSEDEAREAGRRGGEARWAGRRASRDTEMGRSAPSRTGGYPGREESRS
jgi:general stress protein YciG